MNPTHRDKILAGITVVSFLTHVAQFVVGRKLLKDLHDPTRNDEK